jgi:hypothetical protein
MNDGRERTRGLWQSLWNGPLRIPPPQAASIREEETAFCLDCRVIFNVRNRACPKCDGDQFWLIANWNRENRPARHDPRAVAGA